MSDSRMTVAAKEPDEGRDQSLPIGSPEAADPGEINVHRVTFQHAEDLRRMAAGTDLEIVQLAPGKFDGRVMHAQIGALHLDAGDFSLDLRARGVMDPGLVTIGMLLETTGEVSQWRHDMIPGDIVVFPKGVEQEGHGRGRYHYASIVLGEEALAAHIAGERALQDSEFWTKPRVLRPSPALQQLARREIAEKVTQLREGIVPVSPAGVRYFQRSLIEAFITVMLDGTSDECGKPCRNGAKLVRDVEDHVDAVGADRPVHISELCSALGVPRRTLHRAFDDTLGISPIAYLRLRRLSAVRRALSIPDPQRSVTQTALEHGFTEFGRFSAFYRRIFGEFPSQTRQKAVGLSRPR